MKIAFYAAMKPPDDPVPSGDRTMARQLMAALELAGHEVELISRTKCRVRAPEHLEGVQQDAARETQRIAAHWKTAGKPDLIVTYHVYYKSPDLIGAALARAFAIPYVTVEASYAGKRDKDAWAQAQAISSAAIRQARVNIGFTERDMEGVARLVGPEQMALVPPFADVTGFPPVPERGGRSGPAELVCVAMMLKGAKMESFRILAEAMNKLSKAPPRLTIVGDGPTRPDIERLFAGIDGVVFTGRKQRGELVEMLGGADMYVWPGWREAFGLAYLEAQAMGLPVVAMRSGGVEAVVDDGATGLLSAEGDVEALAGNIRCLLDDVRLRQKMGAAAADMVRGERSLEQASRKLDEILQRAMA